MAEDASRSRLGRGLAALIGDVGAETPAVERAQQRSAACRSNSSDPIRAIRAAFLPIAELDELAAFDPRARHHPADRGARRARRRRQLTRSSPANGAGARRSAPACTTCRSSCSRSPTARRSNSRSSKTCSAPISIALEEAAGYQALADRVQAQPGRHRADRRQEPQPCRQYAAAAEAARDQELYPRRQAFRRSRAHADRPAQRGGAGRGDRRARTERAPGRRACARKERNRKAASRRAQPRGKDADTLALEKRAVGCARPEGHH